MSCPDWKSLAAERDRRPEEPASWPLALTHFDSCTDCRREALAADPTLVFRRLKAGADEMTPAQERSEADAVRLAVSAMRTASRLETPSRSFSGWRRWSSAAVLALAALSARGPVPVDHPIAPIALAEPLPAAQRQAAADAPTVEGMDRPGARVYSWDDKDYSVHLIVDPNADV